MEHLSIDPFEVAWRELTLEQQDLLHTLRNRFGEETLETTALRFGIISDEVSRKSNRGYDLEWKEAFEKALSESPIVGVFCRSHIRLIVPEHVKPEDGSLLHLDYGLNMPIPIDDLVVTDEGVRATLSFDRALYHTYVPWRAVVTMGFTPEPVVPTRPKLKSV